MKQAEAFLEYSGFQLEKEENPHFISIVKKLRGVTVKVRFESQPPDIDDIDEDEEGMDDYNEMMEESVHDLTINIYKGDENGPGIVGELAIYGEDLHIIFLGPVKNISVSFY